jgi:hypothetical protein
MKLKRGPKPAREGQDHLSAALNRRERLVATGGLEENVSRGILEINSGRQTGKSSASGSSG